MDGFPITRNRGPLPIRSQTDYYGPDDLQELLSERLRISRLREQLGQQTPVYAGATESDPRSSQAVPSAWERLARFLAGGDKDFSRYDSRPGPGTIPYEEFPGSDVGNVATFDDFSVLGGAARRARRR